MRIFGMLFLLAICVIAKVPAQQCPLSDAAGNDTPSEAEVLEGELILHNGIRRWFELGLSKPECGQASIQVVPTGEDWLPIQSLRGCRVKSTGALDFSPTGYYSLDIYQAVSQIEPVGDCSRKPPLPDYSKLTPDRAVREYRVEMLVDYEPGDHPIVFRVTRAGKELQPWQAYASYTLTGGFVLYGHCGKGFVVDKVFGTPEAKPAHLDEPRDPGDMAMFDPESAAAAGKKKMRLQYTCIRKR